MGIENQIIGIIFKFSCAQLSLREDTLSFDNMQIL